jgi:hypothetical protein
LSAAEPAQLEAIEVTVKETARVLDVGMPDQVDARGRQIESDATG